MDSSSITDGAPLSESVVIQTVRTPRRSDRRTTTTKRHEHGGTAKLGCQLGRGDGVGRRSCESCRRSIGVVSRHGGPQSGRTCDFDPFALNQFAREFYLRDIPDEMRTPWKLPREVWYDKEFKTVHVRMSRMSRTGVKGEWVY